MQCNVYNAMQCRGENTTQLCQEAQQGASAGNCPCPTHPDGMRSIGNTLVLPPVDALALTVHPLVALVAAHHLLRLLRHRHTHGHGHLLLLLIRCQTRTRTLTGALTALTDAPASVGGWGVQGRIVDVLPVTHAAVALACVQHVDTGLTESARSQRFSLLQDLLQHLHLHLSWTLLLGLHPLLLLLMLLLLLLLLLSLGGSEEDVVQRL